jgi:hypothetical protein
LEEVEVKVKEGFLFLALIVLAAFGLSCCSGSPSSNYVWIDVPENGLRFPDLIPVTIEGHATGPEGITQVELFINGELLTTISDPPGEGPLVNFEFSWVPTSPGTYTIHAIAYGADGAASPYDDTTIIFGEKLADQPAAEVVAAEPDESSEEESSPPSEEVESLIQFWAEPEAIQAGDCTEIMWQVVNVKKVIFGGVGQAFEGIYQDCLCKNQTYTLKVIHLDDSEEEKKVNILVTGSCETPEPEGDAESQAADPGDDSEPDEDPEPPPEADPDESPEPEKDTTPPSAPVQSVPSNGLSIDCKYNQNLVWSLVKDKSGISQYQVKVQRHSGDKNWTDIAGSVFSGISGKQHSITVECGWYYRWRVRAVDGAGNPGSWSGWWTFTVNLE